MIWGEPISLVLVEFFICGYWGISRSSLDGLWEVGKLKTGLAPSLLLRDRSSWAHFPPLPSTQALVIHFHLAYMTSLELGRDRERYMFHSGKGWVPRLDPN